MNALTLLEQQHQEVEELANEFLNLGAEAVDEKRQIARTVIEQLSIHATLEEMAFYPTVREAVPELDDTLDEHLQDHQKIKDLAQELLGMDPEDPRFVTTIVQLVGEVMEDLQDDAARRPHPWAPDTPPLNTLAVPIAARLDKLRSQVRDRIDKKSV